MAVNGGNGFELEQWKKALLSRDFDLVHTQLLMLDGDVTPTERAELVNEIFTAVQQIEELTTGKPKLQQVAKHEPLRKPPAASGTSRPSRDNGEETDAPVKKRPRHVFHKPKALTMDGNKYVHCPVCDFATIYSRSVRDDWFCNSCRLFKLRLAQKHLQGRALPSCDHKGKRISSCKGCRRYKLEIFWMAKRQDMNPYPLPLMGSEESSSDVEPSETEDWELE